jgi:hypothetical protein
VEGLCELHRIAVSPNVHIQDGDGGSQQVIVDGGYLDATLNEALHHRTDLRVGEHQVAHDHPTLARGLKRQP